MNQAAATATPPMSRGRLWVRALRPHQWLKNLLVFLPVILAHRLFDPTAFRGAAIAAVAFCLCASSAYLVNDIVDRPADRRHPTKQRRPFASGALTAPAGLAVAAVLLGSAFLVAAAAPSLLAAWLGLYYALTLAYSLWFKRIAVLDVLVLAALYTLRVLAGGAAAGVEPSFWLLAFSMFIFLSLALVKRYAEIEATTESPGELILGRGYRGDDVALLLGIGPAAGFVAVLVLALYINSPESFLHYRHPQVLWLICPMLLYWVTRVWFLTARGRMHEDPVVFAARDWVSLAVAALAATAVIVAT
jgi:4-hydroxybenzoate polyprenyltransferase